MKSALSFRLILLATTLLCHFVYVCSIDCPQTVYVELGHDGIINCRIKNNGDVYWYEGNSTKTSPIVRRENGQKKISQEGSPYDMDEEGSLIIKSLEEQYYGFYSVLNFYSNDQHETAQIKVEMAGSCKTTTQISDYETPLVEDKTMVYVLISIVIAVVVMVIAIVLVLCLMKSRKSDIDRESLMNTLKDKYFNFRNFTCNPNGDKLPASDVFKDIYFTLTNSDNEDNIISSSELIERLFGNERNFVFLDDSEYGRNAFMHYVCSSLYTVNLDKNIILYVNLNGLDMNMTIAKAIDKSMNLNGTCSSDFIRYIMENKRCLFVFDEVNEIYQPGEDESTSNTEYQQPDEETINDVLRGPDFFKKYQNIRILCIPKNKINVTSCLTNKQVFIKIAPFTLESLKLYVANILSCYDGLHKSNTHKSNKATESNTDETNKDMLSVDQCVECVSNLILEEENIIKEIAMCPSLLILFTHSLVADIKQRTIADLRFYIHRWSYQTRFILDCFRFQYFLSEAMNDDFELLMIRLGGASFEKKLKETQFTESDVFLSEYTRTQFEAKTSEKDFETAYAMGLFKMGSNRDCCNDVMNNALYPSPDSIIEFRHNYIQEFLAAKAIAANDTVKKRFLNSQALKTSDRMKRVLQFMHVTETKKRQELLKLLVEEQSWNNLADCLSESENDDDFTKIKSSFSPRSPLTARYSVNIIDMDKHHHCMAVARFCEVLSNHNVSLEAISFKKTCKFEHFRKLQIPEVKHLAFFEIDFQQGNDFVAVVKKAFQLNIKESIGFVKCVCPEEISKEEIQEITDPAKSVSKYPKVQQTNDTVSSAFEIFSNVKWHKLNLETGCWEST